MIRVAVVGAGGIADTHIQALLQFPAICKIVAVVDIYPDKAADKVRKFDLQAQVYGDYRALLSGTEFDLACVCLPPFVHAEVTVALLSAGKHVLVEKPMAPCLAECDRMLAAARASGRLLSVVAQNRFKTPAMRVKALVESGIVGRIVHAQVDSFWYRGRSYYDLWWRGTWEKEGGGCTLNHAVHQIDLFHWIVGMPQAVQAVVANVAHNNSEVEDFSTAVLFYANGGIGQVTASLVHHGEQQQMLIQGERAAIGMPWRVQVSKARPNGFPDPDPEFEVQVQSRYDALPALVYEGHAGQIANVLAAIAGREPLLIDGQAGRDTIELVTAIYASGFQNARVTLPLAPDSPYYTREGILNQAPRFYTKTGNVENFADGEIVVGSSSEARK